MVIKNYKLKYLKYKYKYLYLKNEVGGAQFIPSDLNRATSMSLKKSIDEDIFDKPETRRMVSLPDINNQMKKKQKIDWSYHSFDEKIHFSKDRKNLISKIIDILKSEFNPCELFSIMNEETIERIGSESASASVYKMKWNTPIKMELTRGIKINLDCAIKIMINKSDSDVEKHKNELKYANMASDLVLNDICEYYPVVLYSSNNCDNIITYRKEDIEKGELYVFSQCVDKSDLRNALKKYVKTQISQKEHFEELKEDIRISKLIDKNKTLKDCYENKNKTLSGALLVSERASGDLYQLFFGKSNKETKNDDIWIRRNTKPFWKIILKKIIIAIYHLPFMHNDLHLGNILLVKEQSDDEWMPLIHDFGEATSFDRNIQFAQYSNYVLDYYNFFYSIEEAIKKINQNKNVLLDNNEMDPKICEWLNTTSIKMRKELEKYTPNIINKMDISFINKLYSILDN